MTTPPLDDDLSADLDGAATPDVRQRLASDPAARARQDALRAAAGLVADPVEPLAPPAVDELVAAALAAGADADEAAPGSGRRTRRSGRRRGHARAWTGAGRSGDGGRGWSRPPSSCWRSSAGPSCWRGLSTDDPGNGTSTAAQSSNSSAGAESDHAGDGAMLDGPTSTTTPGVRLGPGPRRRSPRPMSSARRCAPRLPSPAPPPPRPTGAAALTTQAARCATVVRTQLDLEPPRQAATATVAGRPVLIYTLRDTPPNGQTEVDLVAAVDREACTPVITFFRDR